MVISSRNPARTEAAMQFIGDQAIVKTRSELIDIWRDAAPTPSQ